MPALQDIDWYGLDWITIAIHGYAVLVAVLWLNVYFVHRGRLAHLVERLSNVTARVEGRPAAIGTVRLSQLTMLILHLGDVLKKRKDVDIAPVLEFVRQEERNRNHGGIATLVNLTETMIELFPMLGILGTVWAISGIGRDDFSSERLLLLFGTAISTTLWALAYVIFFRITYSAFVFSKVAALREYNDRFLEFVGILELRTRSVDLLAAKQTNGSGESEHEGQPASHRA